MKPPFFQMYIVIVEVDIFFSGRVSGPEYLENISSRSLRKTRENRDKLYTMVLMTKKFQNKILCYLFDHHVNLDKCLLNILNAYKLCNDFEDFQIFTRLRQRLSSFWGG